MATPREASAQVNLCWSGDLTISALLKTLLLQYSGQVSQEEAYLPSWNRRGPTLCPPSSTALLLVTWECSASCNRSLTALNTDRGRTHPGLYPSAQCIKVLYHLKQSSEFCSFGPKCQRVIVEGRGIMLYVSKLFKGRCPGHQIRFKSHRSSLYSLVFLSPLSIHIMHIAVIWDYTHP